jgi:hypothetical protein
MLRHSFVAGRQSSVADRHASESLRVLAHQPQSGQAAPVLGEERNVGQIQQVEQQLAKPLDVPCVGVLMALTRFVRPTKPDQVRGDDAVPGAHQTRNHEAVQVRPRWFAVQQHRDLPVARPFVEIAHP